MTLEILGHSFTYQMENTLRLFYPQEKLTIVDSLQTEKPEVLVSTKQSEDENGFLLEASLDFPEKSLSKEKRLPPKADEQERKRTLNRLLFVLLVEHTGKTPPWGMLSGIRPVRLLHQMVQQGSTIAQARESFLKDYLVSAEKTKLALEVLENQRSMLKQNHPKAFSLYISIPFCPSRCLYCSFVSHAIDRTMKLVPEYVDRLCEEIKATAQLAKELGLRLQTVYVGGGTPTTLEAPLLHQILQTVADGFDRDYLLEYTVEAGRPDTITQKKLEVLRHHGVDRISINPQTMEDEVLLKIGRNHTVDETLKAYDLARSMGFQNINMDLIAGLPLETPETFLSGVERVIALAPENITVHTLTIKRSSRLWQKGEFEATAAELPELLEETGKRMEQAQYRPYYLYRQKGTIENLENIGYSKPNHYNYYNIYTMEEVHTILGVGAGAVSKLCGAPNTLKRVYNFKYPYEYLSQFEEILSRKSAIRSYYERDY